MQYGALKRNPKPTSTAAESPRRRNGLAKTHQTACSSIKEVAETNYGLKNKGMICPPWDNFMTPKAAVIHRSSLSSRHLQTNWQSINGTVLLLTDTVTMPSIAEWPTLINYL